jgi:hypothetical protein
MLDVTDCSGAREKKSSIMDQLEAEVAGGHRYARKNFESVHKLCGWVLSS